MDLQEQSGRQIGLTHSHNNEIIRGLKYIWRLKNFDDNAVRSISLENNLTYPISQVLLSRGFFSKKQINSFLFSSFEKDVFNANLFKDSKKALERLLCAIDKKEKILVFGDYDVDGITSTALFLVALLPLGANLNYYLPNRARDGYGLSEKIVKKAFDNGYKLIVTVDNGITACKAADLAYKLGIDLIITDHHRVHGKIPKAKAIIDANQFDCKYPYKDLAGVGIIFKVVSLIYEKKGLILPEKVYELLMLGTIADVAPLTEENRFWVRFGLCKVNKKRSMALDILVKNGMTEKGALDSIDIAFMIAPQLNALGRLDDPREAVHFLISSDRRLVEKIGQKLKRINEERKRVDRAIYLDIETAIFEKRINLNKESIIMAASQDWPAGVIGLVAGRLVGNYGRPAILFHLDKDDVLKGSCRSIPEFNIFDALNDCKDFLIQFGGHSFAAGLKLHKKNLPAFKLALEEKILDQFSVDELVPKVDIDSILSLSDLRVNFMNDLRRLEPFGNKNEQPAFLIKHLTILGKPSFLKEKHVKVSVFAEGVVKPVIFFNRPELFSFFSNLGDDSFDLACNVTKNSWQGKVNVELRGIDVRGIKND